MYRSATTNAAEITADVLFIPVFGKSDALDDLPWLERATGGEFARARQAGAYHARLFELTSAQVVDGSARARRIVLIGAGPMDEQSPERWRRLGATAGYAARGAAAGSCAFLVRHAGDAASAAQHLADGFTGVEFDGASYKSRDTRPPAATDVTIVVAGGGAGIDDAVQRGRLIGECANFTRGLSNEPANILTPAVFAARVTGAAREAGIGVEVLEESEIRSLNMNLLMSVGQGSAQPPRVIVLRHEPAGAPDTPVLGLIGKGITFDTGGVSIKPAEGMERMKDDMAGGAAVAGALLALARMKCPFRVIGIIPAAENMVSGHASRPGDVVRGASGKTVEIINTDAEGRLILGDALWLAQREGVTHMVDVATLTGACRVALGRHVSGLFGRPDGWVDTVRSAGQAAGDRLWPLPIYEEALEQMRSEIADLVNSASGGGGGASTAAAFLREFAGDLPWAHLDIAGTAWAETKEPYQPKGATGVAMRTLIELAMSGAGQRPRHSA